jgi:hypothetical protein
LDAPSLNGVVRVKMPLQVVVNVAFQCGRAGVAEHPDRDLTTVVVPPLGVDEDFNVTGAAIAGHDTSHLEIGRGFPRSFNGNPGNGTYGNSVFKHGGDPYMRSRYRRQASNRRIYRDVTIQQPKAPAQLVTNKLHRRHVLDIPFWMPHNPPSCGGLAGWSLA